MTSQEKIAGAIAAIDELLVLREKQRLLLLELRHNLDIAARAGVDPNDIASRGYDPAIDLRWRKWPSFWQNEIVPETNFVTLKSGVRVDIPNDWETRLRESREKLANRFKGS
jgi:hypothetical protein